MLLLMSLVLSTATIAGGVFFLRRAPAVGVALLGGLAAGIYGFFVSAADGPRGAPGDVSLWVSWGIGVSGVVGLVALRDRPPARFLRRAAVGFSILGPAGAAILAFLLMLECPPYVTSRAGFCYHEFDMLGGWISQVAVLFAFDSFFLAALLLVSGKQARTAEQAGRRRGLR
jgi:hypothetical protein